MSDEKITDELAPHVIQMSGVSVVNTAHDGYRRAGFVLQKGENILPPVRAAVLNALEADPRLTVTIIAADIDSDTSGRLGDQVISTTLTVDEIPPETEATAPVETPALDSETAQPETPKKGNGKK